MLIIDAQVKTELIQLPCFINVKSISAIEQGYSHQSFKVIDQNQVYFVKRLSTFQTPEDNNLAGEISQRLSITPTLIFSNDCWQVFVYVDGLLLSLTSSSRKDKINTCIETMVICHQELSPIAMTIKSPTLNPKKVISELSNNLSKQQQRFISKIADKLCKKLLILPITFCHGDINFSNIITEQQNWLIDFECACLADAEFDIAMMIAINELDDISTSDIIEQCINSYHLKRTDKCELSKDLIMRYLGFCYLINGLWFKEYGKNMDSDWFKSKANKQFDYFDRLSIDCESLLKQMR